MSDAPASGTPSPDHRPEGEVCSLSSVSAGTMVQIKHLSGAQELAHRLREMGFCEEQRVKLLLKHTNTSIICQVCNVRVGLSSKIAESIMVQPLAKSREKAA